MMNFASFRQNTKKAFAASLIFWLSGVVFLLCCETTKASEMESCPFAKANNSSCKKVIENNSGVTSIEKEATLFECCSFLQIVFNKSQNVEKIQKIAPITAKIEVAIPTFLLVRHEFNHSTTYNRKAFNREKVFLKNCVFRI